MIERRQLRWVLILVCAALVSFPAPRCHAEGATSEVIRAAFNHDCEALLLSQIARARSEILVAAYSITRPAIVAALVDANDHGVRVKVKYDAKQADYEGMKDALSDLRKHGIKCWPIRMSEEHASMHNKFVVIDRSRVLTGSYNYTSPASVLNYENLVLMDLPAIAGEFAAAFDAIKSH